MLRYDSSPISSNATNINLVGLSGKGFIIDF